MLDRRPGRQENRVRSEALGKDLKKLIDATIAKSPNWAGVRLYLYALMHAGNDPYKKDPTFLGSGRAVDELNQAFSGDRAMRSIIQHRDECIQKLGREVIVALERALAIDSRGIEAGDKKPLLGMKHELVINAVRYLLYK